METRVKERLTGAIVLVAVVVLVVPALLSGPRPRTRPPEVTQGSTREMVIDLASGKPAKPEDPERPEPEPATAAGAVRVAPAGLPENAGPAPASGRPAAAALAETSAAPRPPASPSPSMATTPEAAAPAADAGSPPAVAAGPAPPPVARAEAWAVQLGAFSSHDTAQQLVATLRSRGYSAFMLERRADGKVLYRVRVGPEQDRRRAEVIAQRLQGEGYTSAGVAPHP